MLDVTLATEFVPGTNVKNQATGANWMFLRPTLNAGHVLCVGMPRPPTLSTLARLNASVLVITPRPRRPTSPGGADLANVTVCSLGDLEARRIEPKSIATVFVAGWRGQWQLRRQPRLRQLLRTALAHEAVAYYEYVGRFDLLRGIGLLGSDESGAAEQRFVLTPVHGEVQTAVPEDDGATVQFFRSLPVSSSPRLVRVVRGLTRHARARMPTRQPSTERPAPAPSARNPLARLARRTVAKAGTGWLAPPVDALVARHGVLRTARAAGASGPPAYLRDIAEHYGVHLGACSWGLSARGNYSSRKLLFYLDDTRAGGSSARYVAKVVRDPSLNRRLENEYRALLLLSRRSDAIARTVPHPVFFGYHAGLAIVGETAVQGRPFVTRSMATAACPYLHSALEWLTTLAADTSGRVTARPEEALPALGQLLGQFQRLYRLTTDEQRFLAAQVTALSVGAWPLPLAFQHGDPGTWNMLITDDGQLALLDWEAAEPRGIPLWDLFYFLRSYAVGAARLGGGRRALQGVTLQLLEDTALNRLAADAIDRYCSRLDVPRELIEPLFHTCWMHRAVKEATRLRPVALASGHYVNLLQLCVARRGTAPLRRLFNR
jgi:hypothetical protein